jgi:GT2 family glycosyltransferase
LDSPSTNGPSAEAVGVVTIGRNEGERLKRCLTSLIEQGAGPIVYVDSGSTDGSVEFAKSLGIDVVNLDMSQPFTMPRGRNAGFERLMALHPALERVQFVDGDCEVDSQWIERAKAALESRSDVAVVCGFRRERHPHASVYNRLTDLEWQGPVGEIKACGGDALYRTDVFRDVGGFNAAMIAGEEPELCVRIRRAGFVVLRIDAKMTLHDANITKFSQWWKRTIRSGHASAEGMALHGFTPERHKVKETLSAVVHGLIVPSLVLGALATLGTGAASGSPVLVIIGGGGLGVITALELRQALGIYQSRRKRGDSASDARLYTAFCMLGKVPEAIGVLTYAANRLRGRRAGIIEYKTATTPAVAK